MTQPEFIAYEINALRLKKDKPLDPERKRFYENAYKSVMELEEGRVKWDRLTENQQKRMWAIKYECRELLR